MNINNTKNVISDSDTWAGIYNRLVKDFIRITPHAEDNLNTDQLSVYMEISDPDRIQPSYNDGGFCEAIYVTGLIRTKPFSERTRYIPDANNMKRY